VPGPRRRGARPGDDLTAITLIASLIDQAERFLPELVTNARLNGHTWDQIAQALATSPEQAQLGFGPSPRSPIPGGPPTFSPPNPTPGGRPWHSPAAALLPWAKPQVQAAPASPAGRITPDTRVILADFQV
jgi:hypothetical protein